MDKIEAIKTLKKNVKKNKNGCWIWQGKKLASGYGRITIFKNRFYAHRLSYEAFNGKAPGISFVCHSCDVKSCINPKHLWLGNAYSNARDYIVKNGHYLLNRTHCSKGHPFSGYNLILSIHKGYRRRRCRICDNRLHLAAYYRKKATPLPGQALERSLTRAQLTKLHTDTAGPLVR